MDTAHPLQVSTVAHTMTPTRKFEWRKLVRDGHGLREPRPGFGFVSHHSFDGRFLFQGIQCQLGGMYWFEVEMPREESV